MPYTLKTLVFVVSGKSQRWAMSGGTLNDTFRSSGGNMYPEIVKYLNDTQAYTIFGIYLILGMSVPAALIATYKLLGKIDNMMKGKD